MIVALAIAWAAAATLFTAVAWKRVGVVRDASAGDGPAPPVLLLRPADALTPRERTILAQPVCYRGQLEHVVVAPAPPTLPGPHADVRWLPSDPRVPNRKVGHVLHALATLPRAGRVVAIVDCDVAVDGALLGALAATVRAGAALATAAPAPEPGRSLGARLVHAVLSRTPLDFRVLDAMAVGARPVCGKAMALAPEALALLPSLADRVGEDLELASMLHARGVAVRLTAAPARVPAADDATVAAVVARFTRWFQVLRAHRPALHASVPLLIAPSLLLPLVAASTGHVAAWAGVAILWAARTALARRLGGRGAAWWPAGEAVLVAAFVASVVRRTVRWRGRSFLVRRGGRMEAAPA